MGGAPFAVFPCGFESADARCIEHGTMYSAKAVFHPRCQRTGNLAATLFPKGHCLGSIAVN